MSDDQTQGKSIEERIENTTKPQAETPAVEEEQHQEPTPSSDKETPQSEVVEVMKTNLCLRRCRIAKIQNAPENI